jgi:hypothetical protein
VAKSLGNIRQARQAPIQPVIKKYRVAGVPEEEEEEEEENEMENEQEEPEE